MVWSVYCNISNWNIWTTKLIYHKFLLCTNASEKFVLMYKQIVVECRAVQKIVIVLNKKKISQKLGLAQEKKSLVVCACCLTVLWDKK